MKAFDLMQTVCYANLSLGKNWLESKYELTIIKGKINPRKWYYFVFNKPELGSMADVILTLGTDEKQYLIGIER